MAIDEAAWTGRQGRGAGKSFRGAIGAEASAASKATSHRAQRIDFPAPRPTQAPITTIRESPEPHRDAHLRGVLGEAGRVVALQDERSGIRRRLGEVQDYGKGNEVVRGPVSLGPSARPREQGVVSVVQPDREL